MNYETFYIITQQTTSPGVKTSPGSVVGVLEEEATLTCVISGPVPSTVQWFHESSEVLNSGRHTKRVGKWG